jgi:uncharacterized protein YbjQ (UPF0145 family)
LTADVQSKLPRIAAFSSANGLGERINAWFNDNKCLYHVGIQYRSWSKNQELDVLSKAMYHARELAMSRMRAEATAMGADGIVGVKLTIKRLEWDDGDGHKGFRAHDGGPFTSDLSGQDFWSLLHSGYWPVEMVMGSCVYHVAHRGLIAGMSSMGQNVELENYTSAMYEAREIAIDRMQYEAQAAKAEGVVGVEIREGSHGWQTHVIEILRDRHGCSAPRSGDRSRTHCRPDHGAFRKRLKSASYFAIATIAERFGPAC